MTGVSVPSQTQGFEGFNALNHMICDDPYDGCLKVTRCWLVSFMLPTVLNKVIANRVVTMVTWLP